MCIRSPASLKELIWARHPNNALPDDLLAVFKWRDAHKAGITDRRLKRLTDHGMIEKIEHGLCRRTNSTVEDLALIEIALLERDATLCLASALSHADLIDEIPATIHIALRRGTRKPKTSFPITWHWFSPTTFNIGRTPKDPESGLPFADILAIVRSNDIDGTTMHESLRVIAENRKIKLRPLSETLTGFADHAQTQWTLWRTKDTNSTTPSVQLRLNRRVLRTLCGHLNIPGTPLPQEGVELRLPDRLQQRRFPSTVRLQTTLEEPKLGELPSLDP